MTSIQFFSSIKIILPAPIAYIFVASLRHVAFKTIGNTSMTNFATQILKTCDRVSRNSVETGTFVAPIFRNRQYVEKL